MKKATILITLSLSVSLFISCSHDAGSKKEEAVSKNDTAKSDYLKSVSRDPKEYLNDCKKLFAEARRMDSILMKEVDVQQALANQAVKAFTDYAYYCSNDSVAPVFLIKTAQVAVSINNIPQAKLALDKCINEHPKFRNMPAALFLLAQLYDDENSYLNNEEEAKRLYQKIIDEYPKSDIVPSAKGALALIGKTDKEILEEFKKKNNGNH